MARHVHTIFCDDVREEIGGKRSYMGIYGPELIVPSAPAVLPKLCVVVTVTSPRDEPFDSLTFRIIQGPDGAEQTLAEIPVEPAFLRHPPPIVPTPEGVRDDPANRIWTFTAAMTLSPFVINAPTMLRIRVQINEHETLRGPGLVVSVRDLNPFIPMGSGGPKETPPGALADRTPDVA